MTMRAAVLFLVGMAVQLHPSSANECLGACPGLANLTSLGNNPNMTQMCAIAGDIECILNATECAGMNATGMRPVLAMCSCGATCPGVANLASLGDNPSMTQMCAIASDIECIVNANECAGVVPEESAAGMRSVPAMCSCDATCPGIQTTLSGFGDDPSPSQMCDKVGDVQCMVNSTGCEAFRDSMNATDLSRMSGVLAMCSCNAKCSNIITAMASFGGNPTTSQQCTKVSDIQCLMSESDCEVTRGTMSTGDLSNMRRLPDTCGCQAACPTFFTEVSKEIQNTTAICAAYSCALNSTSCMAFQRATPASDLADTVATCAGYTPPTDQTTTAPTGGTLDGARVGSVVGGFATVFGVLSAFLASS